MGHGSPLMRRVGRTASNMPIKIGEVEAFFRSSFAKNNRGERAQ